ncbi:MAG TPA: hydrogenase [Thermoplasmata archaeon]|nr:hydrogenase [Thermoplasmata archaeon]
MELSTGKIPYEILEKVVFRYRGFESKDVLVGPKIGGDAAIVGVGEKNIVVSSDPLIGAKQKVGWYAIHINANDVSICGAEPRYFLSTLFLPKPSSVDLLKRVCEQIDRAAKELKISVIGGHTEITEVVKHVIISGTMVGVVDKKKTLFPGGANEGDAILMTKHAGLEGASILATERYDSLLGLVEKRWLEEAKKFSKELSVVREALLANEMGLITAMHDPTEGGVISGLVELAKISKSGFEVNESNIPISKATQKICKQLDIEPLNLISSGVLLLTCKKPRTAELIRLLESRGIETSVIGKITGKGWILKKENGMEKEVVEKDLKEELWRGLSIDL